jgi:hypothetical protein
MVVGAVLAAVAVAAAGVEVPGRGVVVEVAPQHLVAVAVAVGSPHTSHQEAEQQQLLLLLCPVLMGSGRTGPMMAWHT